jgi:hypothetical protein
MPGRKRKEAPAEKEAPETPEAPASRRRSQRIGSTGQKSKYFEPASDSDSPKNETSSAKPRSKGRPPKKAKTKQPEPESDQDEAEYSNEAQDLEHKAEASDDDFDEEAPPKVTFIPLIKMRDEGGIEYADDKLHPNTLAFLTDLKANYKRTWLKGSLPQLPYYVASPSPNSTNPSFSAHDQEYRRALKDWETYVTTLTDKLVALDPTIPELPFKDVNFRIYRDIRFSNDPTPYKVCISPSPFSLFPFPTRPHTHMSCHVMLCYIIL